LSARLIYCRPSRTENDAAVAACLLNLARCADVCTAPGYVHCSWLATSRHWGRIASGSCLSWALHLANLRRKIPAIDGQKNPPPCRPFWRGLDVLPATPQPGESNT
jgi:hypothetical protein